MDIKVVVYLAPPPAAAALAAAAAAQEMTSLQRAAVVMIALRMRIQPLSCLGVVIYVIDACNACMW